MRIACLPHVAAKGKSDGETHEKRVDHYNAV